MLNNPCKIKRGTKLFIGECLISSDPVYSQFYDDIFGYRAMFLKIKEYALVGLDTVEKLITRWALSTKDETETYIEFVSHNTHIKRDEKIDTNDKIQMIRLVSAISHYETRVIPDEKLILKAWDLIDINKFI